MNYRHNGHVNEREWLIPTNSGARAICVCPGGVVDEGVLTDRYDNDGSFTVCGLFLRPYVKNLFVVVFCLFKDIVHCRVDYIHRILHFEQFRLCVFFYRSTVCRFEQFTSVGSLVTIHVFCHRAYRAIVFPFHDVRDRKIFCAIAPVHVGNIQHRIIVFSFRVGRSVIHLFTVRLVVTPICNRRIIACRVILPTCVGRNRFISYGFVVQSVRPTTAYGTNAAIVFHHRFIIERCRIAFAKSAHHRATLH